MEEGKLLISIKGSPCEIPGCKIEGRWVMVRGKWIKSAAVYDEFFQEGELVHDLDAFVTQLKQWQEKPDVFRFSQKVSDVEPRHGKRGRLEWENFAVIRIQGYEHWLRKQARKDVRESVRRAARDGVEVRVCPYDDAFVEQIKGVYDESPVRQGRKFWHYQKSLADIKAENGTYSERGEYIGAFLGEEMIGFIKMVYVGDIAKTMQVICKEKHFRKRPTSALIAKAVEVCAEKGVSYFNYGPYEYPGKKESSLTQFKYRHGFERIDFPVYHVPLTVKGHLYLMLGGHRGFKRLVPERFLALAREWRAKRMRREEKASAAG